MTDRRQSSWTAIDTSWNAINNSNQLVDESKQRIQLAISEAGVSPESIKAGVEAEKARTNRQAVAEDAIPQTDSSEE